MSPNLTMWTATPAASYLARTSSKRLMSTVSRHFATAALSSFDIFQESLFIGAPASISTSFDISSIVLRFEPNTYSSVLPTPGFIDR